MTRSTKQHLSQLALLLALGACGEFDSPNLNYNTIEDLTSSTTRRSTVATAAQGLIGSVGGTNAGVRGNFNFAAQNQGILGREAYNLDVSNPQNIPTYYTSAGGPGFQNLTLWNFPYATINQANLVITAVDNVSGATTEEKEGVKGYAQTIKALSLLYVIRATDTAGAVLEVPTSATAEPPPVASKAEVYARIYSLLDSGQARLQVAGDTFMFQMPQGFAAFGRPETFIQFNRAVKAKADISNNDYAAALADLAGSFLDTTKAMNFGALIDFSTAGTDVSNPLYDPTARQRYLHPSLALDAQLQAGAAPGDTTRRDRRFLAKARPIAPITRYDFTVNWANNVYSSTNSPWPVIDNEELILLRAEARLGCTGSAPAVTCAGTDRAGALADVNTVRVKSGGLAAITTPTPTPPRNGVVRTSGDALLDEVLYNKRYSLLLRNGDRWVDARRYGLLAALKTDERPGDIIWPNLIIPVAECLPRATQPTGCTTFPTPI